MWLVFFLLGLLSPFIYSQSNKPILDEILVPKIFKENQSARFLCSIVDGELVSFEWFLDDQKLVENNKRKIKFNDGSSELLIKSLSSDDIGEISCVARNKYGNDVRRTKILFNVKPKWKSEQHDYSIIDNLLKEIELDCDANGYPPPLIQWVKLFEDKQTVLENFKSSKPKFKLTKDTAGIYKCIASNLLGSISKKITIGYFGK